MISMLKPMDAKQFHVIVANVRRLMGRSPDPKGSPQERVLAHLELLHQPFKNATDPQQYVADAFLALSENPNIELTARLAELALQHPQCCKTTVMICQVGKTLEQRGTLGAKESDPIPPVFDPMPLQVCVPLSPTPTPARAGGPLIALDTHPDACSLFSPL